MTAITQNTMNPMTMPAIAPGDTTAAAVLAAEKELEPIEGVADGLGTFPDTTETVSKAESRTVTPFLEYASSRTPDTLS